MHSSLPRLRSILLALLLSGLWGCATYNAGLAPSLRSAEQGNYQQAEQQLKAELSPTGDDRLLYYLELGVLAHLSGDYQASNAYLEQAESIAEDLYTISISDELSVFLTSPRQGDYRGSDFERLFINYYKALNYLKLAMQSASPNIAELDAARVEARRLGLKLDSLANRYDRYGHTGTASGKRKLFNELFDLFNRVFAGRAAARELIYRDDAYAHWFIGLLYEKQGELDDARIAYQRAANAYEQGYAQQFGLEAGIVEQAWFDVIRVMEKAGGYGEQPAQLRKEKLSAARRAQLDQLLQADAELVVIQHLGMIPARGELNLLMKLDKQEEMVTLYPIAVGTARQRQAQYQWFALLFADDDLFGLIKNYTLGGGWSAVEGLYTKKIPFPEQWWKWARRNGLLDVLNEGVRITIPYYPPYTSQAGASELVLNGKPAAHLIQASSLATIAVQDQIREAGRDMQAALARETSKLLLVHQAAKEISKEDQNLGAAAKLLGQLTMVSTSAAETRNWLMLPAEIRIQRYPLQSGEQTAVLQTHWAALPQPLRQARQLSVVTGDIIIWHERSTAGMRQTSVEQSTAQQAGAPATQKES